MLQIQFIFLYRCVFFSFLLSVFLKFFLTTPPFLWAQAFIPVFVSVALHSHFFLYPHFVYPVNFLLECGWMQPLVCACVPIYHTAVIESRYSAEVCGNTLSELLMSQTALWHRSPHTLRYYRIRDQRCRLSGHA